MSTLYRGVANPNHWCDGKNHIKNPDYRPYRRGNYRCHICGMHLLPWVAVVNEIYRKNVFLRILEEERNRIKA